MTKGWTKSAWRAKPRIQMPDYPDQGALSAVEAQLAKYPPLVFAGEARRLKRELALAGEGKAYVFAGHPEKSARMTFQRERGVWKAHSDLFGYPWSSEGVEAMECVEH